MAKDTQKRPVEGGKDYIRGERKKFIHRMFWARNMITSPSMGTAMLHRASCKTCKEQ